MSLSVTLHPKELAMLLDGLTQKTIPENVLIHGLAMHSAKVCANDLFIALRGQSFDGLRFLSEAVSHGAIATVCESPMPDDIDANVPIIPVVDLTHKAGVIANRFFDCPSSKMNVTAVTGTDGKTSVSHILAEALQLKHGDCGLIGTMGYGRFNKLNESLMTTPDALCMHRELHNLQTQGVNHAVFEASSHGIDQGRLVGVDIDVAVFTNLGRDHLDYHGSHEAYAATKGKLFVSDTLSHAVINIGESFGRKLAQKSRRHCEVITYALDPCEEANVSATNITCDLQGLKFKICVDGELFAVESSLLGRFNVTNLLAVFSTLLAQGVSIDEAVDIISSVHAVSGRMQVITGSGRYAIVDYAHTPQALESLLNACREIVPGRLVCVFGCGGERDRGKRELMGEISSRLADTVIISDDNPRSEDPQQIINDIQQGVIAGDRVEIIRDRKQAICHALATIGQSDCVVVAGKGHEAFQIVGNERLQFDDAEIVHRALEDMSQ